MKKIIATCLLAFLAITAQAQKFALLDMEYILKHIPAYPIPHAAQQPTKIKKLSFKFLLFSANKNTNGIPSVNKG